MGARSAGEARAPGALNLAADTLQPGATAARTASAGCMENESPALDMSELTMLSLRSRSGTSSSSSGRVYVR